MKKTGFLWQFVAGFALGTVGMLMVQPADAKHVLAGHLTSVIHAAH